MRYHCIIAPYHRTVACLKHEVSLQVVGKDPKLHVCAAREAFILQKLRHPHVVELYGAWKRDEVTTLVLEFAGTILSRTQPPPPAQTVPCFG